MDCRNIRELIDEADKPESIPLEAARHVASCGACAGFADERLRLRQLLASSSKVAAPANFDFVLRQKLARGRDRRWLGEFTPSLSLRFAAAAATLVVAVFAVQFYLSFNKPAVNNGAAAVINPTFAPDQGQVTKPEEAPIAKIDVPAEPADVAYVPSRQVGRKAEGNSRFSRNRPDIEPMRAAAVLLMRDHSYDRQLTVSAISMGAQPIMSIDGGDGQRARVVRTSF